jgi:hypothetical protein
MKFTTEEFQVVYDFYNALGFPPGFSFEDFCRKCVHYSIEMMQQRSDEIMAEKTRLAEQATKAREAILEQPYNSETGDNSGDVATVSNGQDVNSSTLADEADSRDPIADRPAD